MAFDPLLAILGLTALATPTTPTTYAPTAVRAAVRIEAAALPSTPGTGDLAIDSGDSNKLKWWDGSAWQTAGGGGGTPAGANKQIQFNNAGAFGASAEFTWDSAIGLAISKSTAAITAIKAVDVQLTTTASLTSVQQQAINGTILPSLSVAAGSSSIYTGVAGVSSVGSSSSTLYANAFLFGGSFTSSFTSTATTGTVLSNMTTVRADSIITNSAVSGSITISAVTGAMIYPNYYVTAGSTTTITSYYGLLLQTPFISGAGTLTITNRYGIYQADTAAQNFFAGVTGAGVAASASAYLTCAGATTSIAPLRISQSASVPASPTNGDVWLTAANFFIRRNGGTTLLVENATATVTGTMPAWSANNGVLGVATGLTWASGAGGQQLAWTAGTITSASTVGHTVAQTMNVSIGSGVTATGFRNTFTSGANGNAGATAINTSFHTQLVANINSIVDNTGARHVGIYSEVNTTPPSFGWATNSTFVGMLSRIVYTSAATDTNRPVYQMIGFDSEMSMVLSGTSGSTGVVADVIGVRVNPGTFSVASGRTTTIGNYYGLYLATLTTSGAGTFNVSNRYGVFQVDSAALNYFGGRGWFNGGGITTSAALNLDQSLLSVNTQVSSSSTSALHTAAVFARANYNSVSGFLSMVGVYGMSRNTAGDGSLYGLYADAQFTTAGGAGLSRAIGIGINVSSAVTTASKYSYGILGAVNASGASNASNVYGYGMDVNGAASTSECIALYTKSQVPGTYTGTNVTGMWVEADMNAGTASTTATTVRGLDLRVFVNQGAALGYTGIRLAVTERATGSGNKRLVDLLVGGATKLYIDNAGNLKIDAVGSGIFIKEGSNARMGVATLVAGTVTVNTTAVTANSRILLTRQNHAGTVTGAVDVTARVAATSFTITSENAADTSDVAWLIIEPA